MNTNLGVMLGQRSMRNAQAIISQAAERLMTGKRINRASDDPAGMVAVNSMSTQIKVLEKEIEAFSFEEAILGAKEGALSVINDLLLELDGLVVSAANTGALDDVEREGMQIQADEILKAIDYIYTTAQFRGERLFDGLYTTGSGGVDHERRDTGSNVDDPPTEPQRSHLASIGSGGSLNLIDGDLEAAQKSVESALQGINGMRGAIGHRIKFGIGALRNVKLSELESLTQARSDIEDADIAVEVSNLVRGQFLEQASIYAMLIARQTPAAALQLLSASVEVGNR